MNLILSGPIDDALENAVVAIARPRSVLPLHARARRLEKIEATPDVRLRVAALCDSARVDHAFTNSAPGFAGVGMIAMDMDSTLITIECIDEIADFVGKKKEVSKITELTMRGEIKNFAESLRKRVALLAGADADVLRRVFEERLELSPGARELISTAKAANAYALLVSGGFTYFTERLVDDLNLDVGFANKLEVVNGKLTGRLLEPILGSAEKAQIVLERMKAWNQTSDRVLVVGDGANDIPMMNLVLNSVAYHARPAVIEAASHAVRFGSLATVVDFFS